MFDFVRDVELFSKSKLEEKKEKKYVLPRKNHWIPAASVEETPSQDNTLTLCQWSKPTDGFYTLILDNYFFFFLIADNQ